MPRCMQTLIRIRIRSCLTGMRRCEAMHVVSDIFCCSYEKVRTVFYNTFKH